MYSDRLWVKADQPMHFNLLISYDIYTMDFISDHTIKQLTKYASEAKLCNVQSPAMVYTGWFMGLTPLIDTQY